MSCAERGGRTLVPLQDTYVAIGMHEAEGEASTADVKASSVALGRPELSPSPA